MAAGEKVPFQRKLRNHIYANLELVNFIIEPALFPQMATNFMYRVTEPIAVTKANQDHQMHSF